MTKLESLNLDSCKIGDEGLVNLAGRCLNSFTFPFLVRSVSMEKTIGEKEIDRLGQDCMLLEWIGIRKYFILSTRLCLFGWMENWVESNIEIRIVSFNLMGRKKKNMKVKMTKFIFLQFSLNMEKRFLGGSQTINFFLSLFI